MNTRRWISPTTGELDIDGVIEKMSAFYQTHVSYNTPMHIIIGTDSQNVDKTKVVSVIAMICEEHGGIFFYDTTKVDIIRDVRTKLHMETQRSLEVAEQLLDAIETRSDNETVHEMFMTCPIAIHVDAGNAKHGKTKELIPELVGWVKACGYDCEIKPESFVASSIADKYSK